MTCRWARDPETRHEQMAHTLSNQSDCSFSDYAEGMACKYTLRTCILLIGWDLASVNLKRNFDIMVTRDKEGINDCKYRK